MSNSAAALRRWLGMFCLVIATGMLIWGRTFLQSHLSGQAFFFYWAACTLFALGAAAFGVADVWITLRALHHDRGELARATLERIQPNDTKNDTDDPDASTGS